MFDRFDKVWLRLVDFMMIRDVFFVVERVVMYLRRSGIEFCYLVGREMGVGVIRGKRKEVSVFFFVLGCGGEVGYRWVVEMIVYLKNGEEKGLENVVSWYWYDWDDWIVF